jgi:GDP-L-fucose synthase
MLTDSIFVAGHAGLAGSAIVRELRLQTPAKILTRTRAELDLRDRSAVQEFFRSERPGAVIMAAAKVGGILANNTYPADFISENLQIQTNVLDAARLAGVQRLIFLGSSCIYPRLCAQPIREESLLTGPLEPTNRPYAVAKIAGLEMCWAFNRQHGTRYLAAMPANLYGPGDNFDLNTSHVLPALLRKAHAARLADAPSFTVWGSGTPLREFLHADDLARACVHLLSLSDDSPLFNEQEPPLLNVGTGIEHSIRAIAELAAAAVGFRGELVFDSTKPDGTPRKLLDVSRLHSTGWRHTVSLEEGIRATYEAVKSTL